MYFGNEVIKIRYELIDKGNSAQYHEEEIFDQYKDIFSLKDGQKILSQCPLCSIYFHRLVYIIKSPITLKPSRVVILPYLHENRIYLTRDKPHTEYFYTSMDRVVNKEIKQNNRIMRTEKYLMKSIICMNLTASKYYVFSQRGLLRNRISFVDYSRKYGQPVAVSPNGFNFVLARKNL